MNTSFSTGIIIDHKMENYSFSSAGKFRFGFPVSKATCLCLNLHKIDSG